MSLYSLPVTLPVLEVLNRVVREPHPSALSPGGPDVSTSTAAPEPLSLHALHHDVVNLLTVVQGHALLLAQRLGGQDPDVVGLRYALGRAEALLRPRAHRSPGGCDVAAHVRAVRPLLVAVLGPRVDLVLVSDDGVPTADVATDVVDRVLLNLLSNARDAVPPPTRVVVRVAHLLDPSGSGTAHVLLEVSDDGGGMSPAQQDDALTWGWTSRAAGGGTGLGLPGTRELVEEGGGRLELDSRPGRGTRVRALLPVRVPTGSPRTSERATGIEPA